MKNKKTYVIGDIHGGLKSLIQVLERSPFDNRIDQIIFMGDYADGWSETAELIEYLINLQKEAEGRHVFILGNHDVWCREWLMFGNRPHIWLSQGGQATVDSYIKTGYLAEDTHKKFFNDLHNYYIDDENRGFVHGGFISEKGLGHEDYQADYYWDRSLWKLAMLNHNKVSKNKKICDAHKEIFIGHTSTVAHNIKPHFPEYKDDNQPKNGGITVPMNRCNVWNLDTGGGWYGKLTIMDIDSKEYWQSDLLKELYPNEINR